MTRSLSIYVFFVTVLVVVVLLPVRICSEKPDNLPHQHRLLSKIRPNDVHARIRQDISRKLGPVSEECWNEYTAIQENENLTFALDFNAASLQDICDHPTLTEDGEIIYSCDFSSLTVTQSACENIGGQHVLFDLNVTLDTSSFYDDDDYYYAYDDDDYGYDDDDYYVNITSVTLQYKNIGICIGASCNAADFAYQFDQLYDQVLGTNVDFINRDNTTRTPTLSPAPSISMVPSASPSVSSRPSKTPSVRPTHMPSPDPTMNPSTAPTFSAHPSSTPTSRPSSTPTTTTHPSSVPTSRPSSTPTATPTRVPSQAPSQNLECFMDLVAFSTDEIISPFALLMKLEEYESKCVVELGETSITCNVATFDDWNAVLDDACEENDGTYSEMTIIATFFSTDDDALSLSFELNNAGVCIPQSCDGEEVADLLEAFLALSNPTNVTSVEVILEDPPHSTSSSFQVSVAKTILSLSFLAGVFLFV